MSRGAGSPRSSARSVLAALSVCGPAWWWVGSYQGCSEALHGLARGRRRRRRRRRSGGRWWGCGACTRRWESTYNHTYIHTRTNDVHRAAGAASVFWRSWPYTRTAAPLQYSVPGVRITKYFQKSPSHSTVFQFDPLTFSALRGGGRRRPCRRAYRYGLWGRGRASSSAARLPVIGRPNADILHHGPPAARVRTYAHGPERLLRRGSGRRAAAGAPRHRARGTRGGRPVSGERRAAGTG